MIDWTGLTSLDDADLDARALDEYVSQEEAMEIAIRDAEANGSRGPVNTSFSDDDYDDIFMALSDPAQSQDMDMS